MERDVKTEVTKGKKRYARLDEELQAARRNEQQCADRCVYTYSCSISGYIISTYIRSKKKANVLCSELKIEAKTFCIYMNYEPGLYRICIRHLRRRLLEADHQIFQLRFEREQARVERS